jgi:hypothetical protein
MVIYEIEAMPHRVVAFGFALHRVMFLARPEAKRFLTLPLMLCFEI